ncbi:MAG TPA: tetratricopeptide repeat protein [Geobacteraceae bacterium]
MAAALSKKDKLIEEAQRLALRGQVDRAARVYEQVVALEPSAMNLRQKLAELLVKAGRSDDARSELATIGKHFAGHGFYLKAIAVYKQVQKLFPQDMAITLKLAELNGEHGLVGNALAEYKRVFDHYERTGNAAEALGILARMQEVDPTNANIKLKLAEAYFQAAKKDEAYATFMRLASLLQERGDGAALARLNTRIQQLFPEKTTFMLEVLAEQVEEGNAAGAVTGIQALLRNNPNDKRTWELMVSAFRKLNQLQRLKAAYHHYLKFFPEEVSPKKGLLECLVEERDVTGGLALLERYEQELVRAGAAADVVGIYKGLEEIDPINVRVLEGLKRAYEAAGDTAGSEALEPKLASFRALSATLPGGAEQPEEAAPGDAAGGTAAEQVPGAEPFPAPGTGETPVFGTPELGDVDVPLPSDEDDIEIEIEIDEEEGFEPEGGPAAGEDNWLDSFGEIFDSIAASPRGVKFGSDLETSDAQSHHDLGVAFRGMGLYDEAINEFRQAALDPARTVECRVLQGACLRQKGDPATSADVLRSLLKPGLNLDETCLVKYELAASLQALGKNDDAAAMLAEIDAANPGFREVHSRRDAADAGDSLDFSDEDLHGFDL